MTNGIHDPSERNWQLLQLMLDQTNVYHNHKETMAHAGVTVLFALVASMFVVDKWPAWIQTLNSYPCLSSKGLLTFMFVAVWLLVHTFVRWQLRNRRGAAILSAAIERTLRRWASATPPSADLEPYDQEDIQKPNTLLTFLDKYLLPCRVATLHSDVEKTGWPRGLVADWMPQEKRGTGAMDAEWLLWIGSVLALALGLLRLQN